MVWIEVCYAEGTKQVPPLRFASVGMTNLRLPVPAQRCLGWLCVFLPLQDELMVVDQLHL